MRAQRGMGGDINRWLDRYTSLKAIFIMRAVPLYLRMLPFDPTSARGRMHICVEDFGLKVSGWHIQCVHACARERIRYL